jgi:branched-subunit amino acid transport protein
MMEQVWLVLGMAAVTYLPRVLPFFFLQKIQLSPFWKRFLRFIPFSALGALIFPDILSSVGEGKTLEAGIATLVCVGLAWLRVNVVIVVLAGIGTVYLMQMLL